MENLVLKRKEYKIQKEYPDGSYLVSFKDKLFVLRRFDNDTDFHCELNLRKKLKKYGIRIPKIKKVFKKERIVLIEYISDHTMLDELIKGDIGDDAFKELFNIYRFCRFSKIDLNYQPENFATKNGEMYYLSLEFFDSNKEKNLENYGLFYWIYSPQFVEHLKELKISIDPSRVLSKAEANKKIVLISVMHW